MADSNTLAGLLVRNQPEYMPGLVNAAAAAFPEITALNATTIKTTTLNVRVRTNRPKGGFRAIGSAGSADALVMELKSYDLKIYDGGVTIEKAYADQHEAGVAGCMAEEQSARVEGATEDICSQLWSGGEGGFPALSTLIAEGNVVNALGDTSAGCSSAYLVCDDGPDGFAWVMGMNGNITMASEGYKDVLDANGNDAYRAPLLAYVGWKLPNAKKAVRIANLDADHGLTDDLIGTAKKLLPTGARAKLFCNSDQQESLRKSRTATNANGDPAGLPTVALTMPIFVTDAITSTEAVWAEPSASA